MAYVDRSNVINFNEIRSVTTAITMLRHSAGVISSVNGAQTVLRKRRQD